MSDNFHTPWADSVTQYKQADMNAPISDLDKAVSFLKNVMVWCEGDISYTSAASGELSWDGEIKLAYMDEYGNTILNRVTASNVTLLDNQFAYVTLSGTNNAAVTMQTATLSGEGTCNFGSNATVVLAIKAANDDLYYVNLRPTAGYVTQPPYDVGGSFSGQPDAAQVILRYPMPRPVTFPAGMTNSQGVLGTAPSDGTQAQFSLKKGGVEFGTMTFGTGETTAAFAAASATSFSAGDVLTVVAPSPADSTLEDVGFSVVGIRD